MAVIEKKETRENESIASTTITYRLPSKQKLVQPVKDVSNTSNHRLRSQLIKTGIVSIGIFVILLLLKAVL